MATRHVAATLALSVIFAGAAHADEPHSGDAASAGTVVSVFDQAISDIPGKSLVAQEVSYAPGAKDAPHRHAQSAFIMAYVISGSIRSQVEGESPHIYRAGQTLTTFDMNPGGNHE